MRRFDRGGRRTERMHHVGKTNGHQPYRREPR
jgi:hypothetical protein